MSESITIEARVKAPVEKVWQFWTEPRHIIRWCAASEDWHTPRAEMDLRVGGKFTQRMEAKDGSFGFDFGGIYDAVIPNELLEYSLEDGRKVKVGFAREDDETIVTETFDAETENPVEMQRNGWQSILDHFKTYAEWTAQPQRELVGSRVIDAPIALVWQAWTDPKHLAKWWGPNGFFSTFSDFELRENGPSRFVMHGPDGTNYDNALVYAEIVPPRKIVLDHVSNPHFTAIVTFTEHGSRTEVKFQQIFDSVEVCEALRPICEPANEQNFDRITAELKEMAAAGATDCEFVIMRTFDAPKAAVYRAWTDPALVAQWWGPDPFTCPVCEMDVRPGGAYRIVMRTPEGDFPFKGDFPIRGEFGEISPDRIVMIHDATEHPAEWHDMVDPNRGDNPNPAGKMHQTATFSETNGRTTLTIRTRFETPAIRHAMHKMGMSEGWSGSLDRLARLLSK
ncbi:MAG: SRPBCC domain-containing protein [Luteolibacter sp.]